MNMRAPTQTKAELSSFTPVQTGLLQRKCDSCGQHTIAGGECAECQKKRMPLQRRSTNQAEPQKVPPIVQKVLRSPGQSLDAATRAFRESRFGQDFSSVRVHTDAKAAESGRIEPSAQYRRHKSGVQAKLTIGQPGDKYEQEADTVAAKVMSMAAPVSQQSVQREMAPEEEKEKLQTKPLAGSITPLMQREAMPEEEQVQTKLIAGTLQREAMPEEEEVQTKSLGSIQREAMPEEEEVQTKPALQRSPDGSLQAGSLIESWLNASKGGGSPLPDEVRSFMEPRFNADFSQVRVHTDSDAVQMNRELNAQAFTHKQDVYFGVGKAPGKDALTAHELTHVVQQTDKVQRKQEDHNISAIPPAVDSPDLEATLQNIENAYSSAYGITARRVAAMSAFFTNINLSDSPTPTEQALTIAASATIGSATAFIGLRIANSIARSLAGSAKATAASVSTFVANQITDNSKDQGKLATQRALQSNGGRKDAKFRFNNALVAGITQTGLTATETFNNNRNRYRTNQNGLAEARVLLKSLHAEMQNAYDIQYAQAAAQWSALQTNWAGLAGDNGTLVLRIRCTTPGADVQIVGSTLEGLNQITRESLAGLRTVSIGELGLPVRVEGENPHWIFGTAHSTDHISMTGRPGTIPYFEHSGHTASFLIARGIAKYGFPPESPHFSQLQETSAVLMFKEIFDFPLTRLGNLEG